MKELQIYRDECQSGLELTLIRIENVRRMLQSAEKNDPFNRIESRLKTTESILSKCDIRGYDKDIESIMTNVRDIAGIRIVTTFADEVYEVEELIRKIPGINITGKKDYIKEPKDNGYKSLHLCCQVEIYTPDGSKLIPIEIQIRSKAQNLWATVEHKVRYKKNDHSPRATEYFEKMAAILAEFDEVAIRLRDYTKIDNSVETNLIANSNTEALANALSSNVKAPRSRNQKKR